MPTPTVSADGGELDGYLLKCGPFTPCSSISRATYVSAAFAMPGFFDSLGPATFRTIGAPPFFLHTLSNRTVTLRAALSIAGEEGLSMKHGLRRRQFERFCEIMRENPTEAPFRAAKAVLAELDGRGGYTRASSLRRYAGKHRKSWWKPSRRITNEDRN